MLKKIGVILLAIFITLPINQGIAFADTSDNKEISIYEANPNTYALGPNSTAYHEAKGGLLGTNINISNLATSPESIMITIVDTSGMVLNLFSISPGQGVSIMAPGNSGTLTIIIQTGTTSGIYRYQL